MKAVLGIVGLLAVLGIVYGLAFVGIIPTQKLAAKSPALANVLTAMHLAKKPRTAAPASHVAAAKPSAEKQALDAEKQQLAAQKAKLDKDRAALEAERQAPPAPAPDAPPVPDTGAKLLALYGTMSPDDLAPIFAKLPDPLVVKTLMQMDEKKAGKVLAALPPDRAARLSELMLARSPGRTASAAAAPAPASVIQ